MGLDGSSHLGIVGTFCHFGFIIFAGIQFKFGLLVLSLSHLLFGFRLGVGGVNGCGVGAVFVVGQSCIQLREIRNNLGSVERFPEF